MNKTVLISILLLLSFKTFAIYDTPRRTTGKDTVYINSGIITGQIIDIKRNKILILTDNNNRQIIPFAKVKRIIFDKQLVPQVLLNQKIKYHNKILKGRILYYDAVNSEILFLDDHRNEAIRLPLLETSLAGQNVQRLYKYSSLLSVFLSLGILGQVLAKIMNYTVIYTIAILLLALAVFLLFYIFGRVWIKHKKLHSGK